MPQVKITITPKISKNELIIGIQTEACGRLILAKIQGLEKAKKTVLEGDSGSENFLAKAERALSTYVPKPHHLYSVLEMIGQRGA